MMTTDTQREPTYERFIPDQYKSGMSALPTANTKAMGTNIPKSIVPTIPIEYTWHSVARTSISVPTREMAIARASTIRKNMAASSAASPALRVGAAAIAVAMKMKKNP